MQIVTSRPRESNVMLPHSACWYDDVTTMRRPSGPPQEFESVWYPSSWMLLRPFGARNGCWGMGKVVRARPGSGEPHEHPRAHHDDHDARPLAPRQAQEPVLHPEEVRDQTADPVPDGERADQDAAPAGLPGQPDQEQRERHRDEEVIERRLVHALAGLDH